MKNLTGSQRFHRSMRKLTKNGGRRVTVYLDPVATRILENYEEQGGGVSEIVNKALLELRNQVGFRWPQPRRNHP